MEIKKLFQKFNSRLWDSPQRPPKTIEVGCAKITIHSNDGVVYECTIPGRATRIDDWEFVLDAQRCFKTWQEQCGKTGMVSVGNGQFVPFCNVAKISVTYAEQQITI